MKTKLNRLFLALLTVAFLAGCANLKMTRAVQRNDIEATKELIGQGKDVNYSMGMSLLIQATCDQHVEMVKLLLDNGALVDCQDPHGYIQVCASGATPLSCAAERGNAEIARLLIAHGADVNHASKDGVTPLMAVGKAGSLEIAEELLKHGADVNHKSKINETPLMFAAYGPGDNLDLVVRLVQAGADINSKTPNEVTAFGLAALAGNTRIALWLYEKGADPHIPEQQCEINGKVAQLLGDYYLSQDNVEKARSSFQQARDSYRATITAVKGQLANVQLSEGLVVLAEVAMEFAGAQQWQMQSRQLAQINALRNAQRSGGGIQAYSLYMDKYNKAYVPTYATVYFLPSEPPPAGASFDQVEAYCRAKIKCYEKLASLMGKVLECFSNNANVAELHARIENLGGQSHPIYSFAIRLLQESARAYAAKTANTNIVISPMELPENLYGKQIQSEIRFNANAVWKFAIMAGWTPATQYHEGYDMNRPFLRITFIDSLNQQTGEIYFRMNQAGDKMTVVYTTKLHEPDPHTINGEYDLSDYESRIRDDLQRVIKAQSLQLENSQPAM